MQFEKTPGKKQSHSDANAVSVATWEFNFLLFTTTLTCKTAHCEGNKGVRLQAGKTLNFPFSNLQLNWMTGCQRLQFKCSL